MVEASDQTHPIAYSWVILCCETTHPSNNQPQGIGVCKVSSLSTSIFTCASVRPCVCLCLSVSVCLLTDVRHAWVPLPVQHATLDDNAITMPNLLRAAGATLIGDSVGTKSLDTSDAGCNAKDAAVSVSQMRVCPCACATVLSESAFGVCVSLSIILYTCTFLQY